MQGVTPEAVFEVGFPTGTLVSVDGAVWLFDWTGVTRVDPTTNQATRYPLTAANGEARPAVVAAVGFGSLWVSDFDRDQLRRYPLTGGAPSATIDTPKPTGLLVAADALWVANHRDGSVSRIDPTSGDIAATVAVGKAGPRGPEWFASLGDLIWVTVANEGKVAAIDPATNKAVGSIPVDQPAVPCGGILARGTRLFVSSCASAEALGVVDTATMAPVSSPAFDGHVTAPVTVGDGLWLGVVRATEGDLTALDPETLEIGRSLAVSGGAPYSLLVSNGSLWVAIENEREQRAWLLRLPLSGLP